MKKLSVFLGLFVLFSCIEQDIEVRAEEEHIPFAERGVLGDDEINCRVKDKFHTIENPLRFEDFKTSLYKGNLAKPNFTNSTFSEDQEFVEFINKEIQGKTINFAGHYTIIEKKCGMECIRIFVIDRKTGEIVETEVIDDGRFGFEYRKDSNLLIANSDLFVDNELTEYYEYWCKPEFHQLKGKQFEKIE